MANGQQRRTSRLQRVNSVELPPTLVERTWDQIRRRDVLLRVALCIAAMLISWLVVRGWQVPFGYRTNYTPSRSLVARVDFTQVNRAKTDADRQASRERVFPIFINNTAIIEKLLAELKDRLNELAAAETAEKIRPELAAEFFPATPPSLPPSIDEQRRSLDELRKLLIPQENLERFYNAVAVPLFEIKSRGVLDPEHPSLRDWNRELIKLAIRVPDITQFAQELTLSQVRIEDTKNRLQTQLKEQSAIGPEAGKLIFDWINPRLTGTLEFDKESTQSQQDAAEAAVPNAEITYKANVSILAPGGEALDYEDIKLLQSEHQALLNTLTWRDWTIESAAVFGMFIALFTLTGVYCLYREQSLLSDLQRLVSVLVLSVITIATAYFASGDGLRAELVPLLVFAMTIAIAFHAELALLLGAELGLVIAFSLGQGLVEYVIMLSAVASGVLLIGQLRTRRKLFFIALVSALVTGATALGVNLLDRQPLGSQLFLNAGLYAVWAMTACCLVSVLLPFIEQLFGVLTDLRLMELGDPAHPLLQQLVQRAPGTYNHSISVAAIAEAAAEAIGARGLLVRVGAYFHDIGKMNKPHYFVENQGREGNRHESLNPAMSTLVIIAHIKDGAELARQHHLPQAIIDFILQHHGTTLVEYFFHRASRESAANPDAAEVDEASFRYPGPKPQTKESGILMLADAVESAGRALGEPTPARIEGLVHDLTMKRLLDGQFDECGLTLCELATVQESLVKSLTAVYHGRIKYPEQRTA